MSKMKVVYGILLSGLVLYFLLYSLIVRKLPVVKIYFEAETQDIDNVRLEQDGVHDSSLKADGRIASVHKFNSSREETAQNSNVAEGSRGKEKSFRGEILLFLQDLGVPLNKADIFPENNPTKSPPRINPNGASLPMLMRKMDEDLNISADKPCPTSHLKKGKPVCLASVGFFYIFIALLAPGLHALICHPNFFCVANAGLQIGLIYNESPVNRVPIYTSMWESRSNTVGSTNRPYIYSDSFTIFYACRHVIFSYIY